MRRALKLHPASCCSAVTRIEVDVTRPRADDLVLSYVITGKIGDLALPALTAATHADELWRHTCFEAFIRPAPDDAYYELNFAPSTQWAAYRFDSYRRGMRPAAALGMARIEVEQAPDHLTLRATLQWDALADLGGAAPWHLGLAAVVEETNGGKSYWALAHPPGKPDFHHADGFALEFLPA